MKKWVLKAIVQKSISYLPGSHRINYFFQKHVTGGVLLDDQHFALKYQHAREHVEAFRAHQEAGPDRQVLELGTGWYPVVPLLFFLTASGRVRSLDIRSWMTRDTQQQTLEKYVQWKREGKLDEIWPLIDEQRWETLETLSTQADALGMDAFNELIGLTPVVGDARKLELPDGSVDFICSNNTFEHIPRAVLKDILAEFMRVLKSGACMSHFIDMSDHFAHFDTSIGIYNFLKFSERRWSLIDNSIQPQNRMRMSDYRRLYEELDIPISGEELRPGQEDELRNITLDSGFASYKADDLAISHASLLSIKA